MIVACCLVSQYLLHFEWTIFAFKVVTFPWVLKSARCARMSQLKDLCIKWRTNLTLWPSNRTEAQCHLVAGLFSSEVKFFISLQMFRPFEHSLLLLDLPQSSGLEILHLYRPQSNIWNDSSLPTLQVWKRNRKWHSFSLIWFYSILLKFKFQTI